MERYVYGVEVPMAGGELWFRVVTATTPEIAGEIVRVLLMAAKGEPSEIKVVKILDSIA